MNEYLIEDEYSFYEVDPECKIGIEKERMKKGKFSRNEKCEWREAELEYKTARSSRRGCRCCFCLLLCLIFSKKA